MHIVVIGDPVSGFDFVGPFDTNVDAAEYAGDMVDRDAWVAQVDAPLCGQCLRSDDCECVA